MKIRLLCLVLGLVWACAVHAADRPLRFWAVTGSVSDVRLYRELAADFTAKTGIEVEVTPLAWGSFATKYFVSMAAGLPPDIGITNLGGPFDYGSVGGLVDLREAAPHVIDRFDPDLLPMFEVGDKLYGLPNDLSTCILIFRQDIFEKHGWRAPKTWSEMDTLIGQMEAEGYRYYFGFPGTAQWALGLYTMPYGLPSFERTAKGEIVCNWLEPKYLDGVSYALSLWHLHDTPGRDLGSRIMGMFRSSKPGEAVPLMIDLPNAVQTLPIVAPELNGKWDIAPWPKADDGNAYNIMGGTSTVIFRKSERQSDAVQWLDYLNSVEAQRIVVRDRLDRGDESGLNISALTAMWEPQNDPFWAGREFDGSRRLVELVRGIMPTFGTSQSIQGLPEAGRIEANLLDQMGSWIREQLDQEASRRGISRTELFRRMGSGEAADFREAIRARLRQRLEQEYAEALPEAMQAVRQANERYVNTYGKVMRDIETYERAPDMLQGLVGAAALLGFGTIAWIGASPKLRKHAVSYAFVAIPVGLATLFVFVPALAALYLSMTRYHPVLPLSTAKWVGFGNYAEVLAGTDFRASLLRTVIYAAWTLPVGLVLSLLFANLLNNKLRAERLWRFLYFSPLVTSVVSIALIFTQIFLSGKQGWLNAILLEMGWVRDPVPFLTSDKTFLDAIIILAIWHGFAFSILVFLAGLQQVPNEHFEAAAVDGAGPARRVWHVALPGLRPQIYFLTVLGLIGSFQVFETIYMLANKSGDAAARFGPNDSGLTMVPLIYHTGFESFEMGRSASIAYLLFVIILAITAVQMRLFKRWEV